MLNDKEVKYYAALKTLLDCHEFVEDMEDGNYHSALSFLEEMRDFGYFKEWAGGSLHQQRLEAAQE